MENKKSKILVADDEREIRDILTILLTEEGFEVILAENGREAVEKADESVDMYILDVNMPEMSGYMAGVEIRKRFLAPIMFLTAYSGESDRMMGFSAGADDYMPKPFSNVELLIRVKSLLRRVQQYTSPAPLGKEKKEADTLVLKDLVLDRDSQTLTKNGERIVLTYTEYKILELLMSHPGKIFSLENIYQSIWQEDAVGDGTIMVHIKNIRKKTGDSSKTPRYIKTAWGKGYYVE